jgi:hypothetical protein
MSANAADANMQLIAMMEYNLKPVMGSLPSGSAAVNPVALR